MKLKVCGMKFRENIEEVASLHPDYMGFIFYKGSKRFFEGRIPELDASIRKIGVFVNEDLTEVVKKVRKHQLQGVQLHGDEDVAYCSSLKNGLKNVADLDLIKVFPVRNSINLEQLRPYNDHCDYFLFDTLGKERGGTGVQFNWEALADYDLSTPYLLSGGIGPDDLDSLRRFSQTASAKSCHAVDVNSRFEDFPGMKNIEKLKSFIDDFKEMKP